MAPVPAEVEIDGPVSLEIGDEQGMNLAVEETPERVDAAGPPRIDEEDKYTKTAAVPQRGAIEAWLREHDGASPLSGAPLSAALLIPVPAFAEEARAWEAAQRAT